MPGETTSLATFMTLQAKILKAEIRSEYNEQYKHVKRKSIQEMMTIGKMVELKTAERSNEPNNLKVETKLHSFPQKHSQNHITFFKFP